MGEIRTSEAAVTITKPDGTFSIVYGLHTREQNASDIPAETSLLLLETGVHTWLDEPEQTIERLRTHVQYARLFEYAEKHHIPVAFVDLKYRYPDMLLLLADNAFSAGEWIAGYQLLQKKGNAKERRKNLVLGAWLLLPFAANIARLTSAVTGIGLKQTAALKKLSHRLHPEAELLYLTFRNAVIAEKMEYLAKLGYFKHQTVVLGAAHVGVEDMLEKSSQQRIAQLKQFQSLLHKLVRPEYLSSIMILTHENHTWKVDRTLIVPELSNLLTEEKPEQRVTQLSAERGTRTLTTG